MALKLLRHGDKAMKGACLVVQNSFGCKNAEFDAYFKIGEKGMKNCSRKD
jgi:hypothetical protein